MEFIREISHKDTKEEKTQRKNIYGKASSISPIISKFAENYCMKTKISSILILFFALSFAVSCASVKPTTSVKKPEHPSNIMGKGNISAEKLALFLLQNNPRADGNFVQTLAQIYIEEASFEGVNHDVAFSQMCLETGFLNYGGLVQPEWYNFCGLGAIGPQQPGLVFPDPRTGVRAHIQHLKGYATEEPLKGELVDPRYRYVKKGSSPNIEGLAGTWAADRQYAVKINAILQRLYEFSF
jgi:hypothetical protein